MYNVLGFTEKCRNAQKPSHHDELYGAVYLHKEMVKKGEKGEKVYL